MREAWEGLTEYNLEHVCCRIMSKWGSIQMQNGKWLIFDTNGEFRTIKYCPFCGSKLQDNREVKKSG